MSTFGFVEAGLPTSDDKGEWKKFWISRKQPWRTEPRISKERQHYLAERREIKHDIEQRIYPFKDIKLNRADVEWLLSTHDNNRGPIDWNDEKQRKREGLDLRGADISNEDLSYLPLVKVSFGFDDVEVVTSLIREEPDEVTETWLAKLMRVVDIVEANLQGTSFAHAQLQSADLKYAQLQGAFLSFAQLQGADPSNAILQEALIEDTQLQGADILEADLQGATLMYAQLQGANLYGAKLQGADLRDALQLHLCGNRRP